MSKENMVGWQNKQDVKRKAFLKELKAFMRGKGFCFKGENLDGINTTEWVFSNKRNAFAQVRFNNYLSKQEMKEEGLL